MKIEIVKTELPHDDADEICEKVNLELEGKNWSIEINDGMPRFYGCTDRIYWDIYLDGCDYDMVWKLNYGFQYVGVVKIEDDVDILYNI